MRQVHFIIFLFSHSTLKMHFFLKKLNLSHKQWELNHSIGETELFITLCHLWCVWNPIIASNYLNYLYASRKHIVHSTEISFHYLPSFIVHSTEMTSYRSFMFLFEKWEVGVGPLGERTKCTKISLILWQKIVTLKPKIRAFCGRRKSSEPMAMADHKLIWGSIATALLCVKTILKCIIWILTLEQTA